MIYKKKLCEKWPNGCFIKLYRAGLMSYIWAIYIICIYIYIYIYIYYNFMMLGEINIHTQLTVDTSLVMEYSVTVYDLGIIPKHFGVTP